MSIEIRDDSNGLSVLDGIALVTGAAVASVHIRAGAPERTSVGGWLILGLIFTWLAVTSAGPFVFLVRRYGRRLDGFPGLGDVLWALIGAPWVFSSLVRTAGPSNREPANDPAYAYTLTIGLVVAIVVAAVLLFRRWRSSENRQGRLLDDSRSRTEWLGLVVAALWPLQGLSAIVVLGG